MFGDYENNGIADVELGDDFWEVEPNKPLIPEGEVTFYIDHYEPKYNPANRAFGHEYHLVPYQDQYGENLPLAAQSKLQKKYFFMGRKNSANDTRLSEVAQSNEYQTFLTSIGVTRNENGAFRIDNQAIKGTVVKANVVWKKLVSNRENPNTGIVPTEIDENDPYSYINVAELQQGTLRGVRDPKGNIVRLNV